MTCLLRVKMQDFSLYFLHSHPDVLGGFSQPDVFTSFDGNEVCLMSHVINRFHLWPQASTFTTTARGCEGWRPPSETPTQTGVFKKQINKQGLKHSSGFNLTATLDFLFSVNSFICRLIWGRLTGLLRWRHIISFHGHRPLQTNEQSPLCMLQTKMVLWV